MREFNSLLEMYNSVPVTPVDKQIVMKCNQGRAFSVRVELILGQYKYCILTGKKGDSYRILKSALEHIYSKSVLEQLEEHIDGRKSD